MYSRIRTLHWRPETIYTICSISFSRKKIVPLRSLKFVESSHSRIQFSWTKRSLKSLHFWGFPLGLFDVSRRKHLFVQNGSLFSKFLTVGRDYPTGMVFWIKKPCFFQKFMVSLEVSEESGHLFTKKKNRKEGMTEKPSECDNGDGGEHGTPEAIAEVAWQVADCGRS